jgi:hypothetical protein
MAKPKTLSLLAAVVLALAPEAFATTLVQMNLADLAGRADKIFRGTVLSVKPGTVAAGGGELSILVYRLRVEERFKGDFGEGKAAGFVEIRMLAAPKEQKTANGQRRLGLWNDLPRLDRGQDYVLFTTAPSRIGLSTTVGLGQGAFAIRDAGKDEEALNAFGNRGLNRGLSASALRRSSGPIPYGELAQAIRSLVGR